jgi:hypothetical protein
MFKASPSSGDLPPGWTASDFDEYKDYMGDNWLPPSEPGHNGPPGMLPWMAPVVAELTAEEAKQARREQFEAQAQENLRGLYLAQLKCLLRAADDPRVTKAHGQVLARIIRQTNNKTGMSYPGRDWMAGDITYYDDNFEPQHYEPQSISNLTADLRRWGYLDQDKRGSIEGKGRAVAHYVTLTPELACLQQQITAWCLELRDKPKRQRPRPDLLTGEYGNDACLTDGKVTQKADLLGEHSSNGSDLLSDHPKSPRESRKHAPYLEDINLEEERGADAPSLPLHENDASDATATPHANGSGDGAHPQPGTPSVAPSSPPPSLSVDGNPQPLNRGAARRAKAGSAANVRVAFDLFVETAKRCGLAVPRKADTWSSRLASLLKGEHGLKEWREMLSKLEASPFLRGENDRAWRADIDWLLHPANFEKVLSGKYDRAGTSSAKGNGEALVPIETWRRLNRIYPIKTLSDWRLHRDKFGPAPDEHGCRAPLEFIRELGLSSTGGST